MAGHLVQRPHVGQCPFEIAGVPQDDGRDQQVEAGGAVGLVLEPTVAQFAELVGEERTGEPIARLAPVQPGLGPPAAQIDVLQSVEHEDRAFQPPDFA